MDYTILIIIYIILLVIIPIFLYIYIEINFKDQEYEEEVESLDSVAMNAFVRQILPNTENPVVANLFGILAARGEYNQSALAGNGVNLDKTDWYISDIVIPRNIYTGFLNLHGNGYVLSSFDTNYINYLVALDRISNPFIRGQNANVAEIQPFLMTKISYILIHYYLKSIYPELNDNFEAVRSQIFSYLSTLVNSYTVSSFTETNLEFALYSDGTYINEAKSVINTAEEMSEYINGTSVSYYVIKKLSEIEEFGNLTVIAGKLQSRVNILMLYYYYYMNTQINTLFGSGANFAAYPFVQLRDMTIALFNSISTIGVTDKFLFATLKLIKSIDIEEIEPNPRQLFPLYGIENFNITTSNTSTFISSWSGAYRNNSRFVALMSPLLSTQFNPDGNTGFTYTNTTRHYYVDDFDLNTYYANQILPTKYKRDAHMPGNYIYKAASPQSITENTYVGFTVIPIYIQLSETEDLYVSFVNYEATIRLNILYIENDDIYQYFEFDNLEEISDTYFFSKYSCSNLQSSTINTQLINDNTVSITRDNKTYYYYSDQNVAISNTVLEDFQQNTIEEVVVTHETASNDVIQSNLSVKSYYSTRRPGNGNLNRIMINSVDKIVTIQTSDGTTLPLQFYSETAKFPYTFYPTTANIKYTIETPDRLYVNPYGSDAFLLVNGVAAKQDSVTKSFFIDKANF